MRSLRTLRPTASVAAVGGLLVLAVAAVASGPPRATAAPASGPAWATAASASGPEWATPPAAAPPGTAVAAPVPTETASAPAPGQEAVADLVDLLPAGAFGVMAYDPRQQWRFVPEGLEEEERLPESTPESIRELVEALGIDFSDDFERVAGALVWDAEATAVHVAVAARASFDRGRVEEALGRLPSSSRHGHTVWSLDVDAVAAEEAAEALEAEAGAETPQAAPGAGAADADPGGGAPDPGTGGNAPDPDAGPELSRVSGFLGRRLELTVLDDLTLAAGDPEGLDALLRVAAGAAPSVRSRPEMAVLVDEAAARAENWTVLHLGELRALYLDANPDAPPAARGLLGGVEAVLATSRNVEGADVELRVRNRDEAGARLQLDSLDGMMAMARMQKQETAEAQELLDLLVRGLTTGAEGTDLVIRLVLTADDLERYRSWAEKQFVKAGTAGID